MERRIFLGVAKVVFPGEESLAAGGELAQFFPVVAGGGFVGIGSSDGFVEQVNEGGRDPGNDATHGEREAEGEADFLGRFCSAVPPFAGAFHAFGPGAHAHGFDGDDGCALLFGEGQDVAAEIPEVVIGETDREHDRVEVMVLEGGQGALGAVGGEAEPLHFSFLAGLEEGLHGAAGAEGLAGILGGYDVVELVEVEVISFEALQGAVEFLFCAVLVAGLGFAGEEVVVAFQLLEGGAEFDLTFSIAPVGGCDVVVIESAIEGMADGLVGAGLVFAHEGEAGEADDGNLRSGAAELPIWKSLDPFGDIVGRFDVGEEAFEADGAEAGSTDHADEGSSFHGLGYDGAGSGDPQLVLVGGEVRFPEVIDR